MDVLRIAFKPLIRMLSERSVGEKDIGAALQLLIDLYGDCGNFFTMIEAEYYFFLMIVADVTEGKIDFFEALTAFAFKPQESVLGHILTSRFVYNYRYDVEIWRKAARIWRSTGPAKYYALPPEARSPEKFRETIGLPLTGIYAILTRLSLPALIRQVDRLAGIETVWRGAIALSAIRLFEAQNGRLPKNLKELGNLVPEEFLIDPFSGKEIVYRLEGNDFCLYSVGLDGVDGNAASGVPYFKEKKSPYDLQDIIFHAPR